MVSGRREQQTALPTSVCLVGLSNELTGMIGEGDRHTDHSHSAVGLCRLTFLKSWLQRLHPQEPALLQ